MTKMSWLRRTTGAAAVLAIVTGLAACGGGSSAGGTPVAGPWDAVVAAAEDEGQLTFYSSMPESQNNRLVEAFNGKYPDISVNVVRGAGELPARVDSEIKNRSEGADVFVYSAPSWFSEHHADLLNLDGPSVQGWLPEAWQVPNKAIIPSSQPFSILVWNTQKFPQGFTTWQDLLDPAVKGAVGVRSDVTVTAAGYLDFLETQLGDGYLTALGAQDPKFYPSAQPMTQAVASGEIGVATASTPAIVKGLQEQGAPIQSVVPSPSYWFQFGGGVLAKSTRPNASRVFVDFVMSPEGQAALNGDGLGGAGRAGVPGAIEPKGATMLDSEKYPPARIAEFEAKFKKWFG